MDNPIFKIRGQLGSLQQVIDTANIVLQHGHRPRGYKIDDIHGFVLYWHRDIGDKNIRPAPLNISQIVKEWITENDPPHDEGYQDDTDNIKGFYAYTGEWGFIGDDHYSYLAIRPDWCWISK